MTQGAATVVTTSPSSLFVTIICMPLSPVSVVGVARMGDVDPPQIRRVSAVVRDKDVDAATRDNR